MTTVIRRDGQPSTYFTGPNPPEPENQYTVTIKVYGWPNPYEFVRNGLQPMFDDTRVRYLHYNNHNTNTMEVVIQLGDEWTNNDEETNSD